MDLYLMFMENKKYYTRIWPGGRKHIFQFKRNMHEAGYVEAYMSCSNDQADYFDNSNGSRNVIYIGNEGSGKGSMVVEAHEDDINFLHFVRDNCKYDEGKGYIDLPYLIEEKLWSERKIPELNPLEKYLEERITYYEELLDMEGAHNSSDRYEFEGRLAAYKDALNQLKILS